MTDYNKTAARADESLRRKGGIVTLHQVVTGEYDTATGAAPTVETDYQGTGVKIGYDAEEIAGTTIQSGDEKLLLSPLQRDGTPMPTPTTADQIVMGTARYSVKHVGKTAPVDVAVLFTLQLRGLV
jgi:hypothetical protein